MSKTKTRSVSLFDKEEQIIEEVVEKRGLGGKGFSAALRMIIREWADWEKVKITEKGREALREHENQR